MKYNLDTLVMHITGKPAMDQDGEITYRRGISMALLSDTGQASGEAKASRFNLAVKVQSATETTDFTIDEAKVIKDHVGMVCGALLVGRIHEFLENPLKD